jgi:hypothetical protein
MILGHGLCHLMLDFDMLAVGTGHKLQAMPPLTVQQGVPQHGVFHSLVVVIAIPKRLLYDRDVSYSVPKASRSLGNNEVVIFGKAEV